jgi:cyclin-A
MSSDFSYFSLMQVAEEYSLVPDALYLTINYIDHYLSGNKITALQLLGVACMLILIAA